MNARSFSSSLAFRAFSCWKLKLALLIALNAAAYLPYAFLQHHFFFPVTQMPASFVDRLVPFIDTTVWIYLSVYLMAPLAPVLMPDRRQLLAYARGILLISLTANVIFIFWPTSYPREGLAGTHWLYQYLVQIDRPVHACPSLHAAFAVYAACCCHRVFAQIGAPRIFSAAAWAWAAAILFSTLSTKQHVFLDIVAGSFLGLAGYGAVFGTVWFGRSEPAFSSSIRDAIQPQAD